MATQAQKTSMRPKIRKVLSDFSGIAVGKISGTDNLAAPPPLGMDSHSVKGMKERLNSEVIVPAGGKGRVTYLELEAIHKNKKKVSDLESLVFGKVS